MATAKKPADEPQTQTTEQVDPEAAAQEQADVQAQADKDRDEVARAAQEAEGPTPIPANFEDTAAHARVADERAASEQGQQSDRPADKPDGEASQ
jgi:hypothetical protein